MMASVALDARSVSIKPERSSGGRASERSPRSMYCWLVVKLPYLERSKSSESSLEGANGTEEPERVPTDTADRHMAQMLAKLPQGGEPDAGVPGATGTVSNVALSSAEVDDAPRRGQGDDPTRLLPGSRDPQVSNALESLFDSQRPSFRFGQPIGRYIVLEELGAGAMGAVLKAYDAKLDRVIALKLLHAEVDEYDTVRLRREAQALAKLSHPNVIQVFDVGEVDEQTFIAMEMVMGQTLREWTKGPDQPRGWRECLNVYMQAGAGLAAAHEVGLIHRDFKPANAIIDIKGQVRVLDFGLARRVRQTIGSEPEHEADRPMNLVASGLALEATLTHPGTVMGTPPYMPPEQWRGEEVGPHSDQFSFCVALYEALYGARPFRGKTRNELMVMITEGRIATIDANGPAVPSRVRNAVLRGLSSDPQQRWSSMDDLLAELRRLAAPPRHRYMAGALAVGLAAMAGSGGYIYYLKMKDRCTGALDQMEGIWDDARRQQVEAAILGTEVSYAPGTWTRVEQRLDDYADAWMGNHTDVCEATSVRGEQSTHLMDVRMACLERRRGQMRALVEVLLSPDEDVVREAVKAVQSLED
ncbi:MAG: serine/threonine-protein kinase, partial [Myxococcota bacterium]